ncbi:hypothetical protein BO78DRAFT_387566 [Aspergillus sclerotiicarbonarius CBS 121057]|uniref:Uncharacterized protein n=1 Tax=Aspergillus sclerotiicarbonarius (strain CBS 121057 / IBT 28362) TaxID=1448318 RepID=A0A319EG70_ASPSB|nr:hypothetical protein BO78DRAFT_387566 [Aspergillus sclerotiicarbonarius CBS 121057]
MPRHSKTRPTRDHPMTVTYMFCLHCLRPAMKDYHPENVFASEAGCVFDGKASILCRKCFKGNKPCEPIWRIIRCKIGGSGKEKVNKYVLYWISWFPYEGKVSLNRDILDADSDNYLYAVYWNVCTSLLLPSGYYGLIFKTPRLRIVQVSRGALNGNENNDHESSGPNVGFAGTRIA